MRDRRVNITDPTPKGENMTSWFEQFIARHPLVCGWLVVAFLSPVIWLGNWEQVIAQWDDDLFNCLVTLGVAGIISLALGGLIMATAAELIKRLRR